MRKQSLKVVGLDPSFRNLGIAIGALNTKDGSLTITHLDTVCTVANQSKKIRNSTWDIQQAKIQYEALQAVTHDADIVCIEVPYGSQDVKAAVGRGICLGLLSTIKAKHIIYITPQANKKTVGNEKATKKEVVAWASKQHPEAPWHTHRGRITTDANEHCADAIATIYSAAMQEDFEQFV